MRELFHFITDVSITTENVEKTLAEALKIADARTIEDVTAQETIDEEVRTGTCSVVCSTNDVNNDCKVTILQVFKSAYIPRTLDEVYDFERDVRRVKEGVDTNLVKSLVLCPSFFTFKRNLL